jgi:hypothetical protein
MTGLTLDERIILSVISACGISSSQALRGKLGSAVAKVIFEGANSPFNSIGSMVMRWYVLNRYVLRLAIIF